MSRPLRAIASAALLASIACLGRDARAADACISAYEQTQTLRKDGKLVAAKAQAVTCVRSDCPALLTKDCTRWLGELETSTPTVVFEVRTKGGLERTDVKISSGGEVLVARIDGKAVPVDPGVRTFLFEPDGEEPLERTVMIREGERNKKVTVVLDGPDREHPTSRPIPLGFWLFGGASIVALSTSAVFALDGFSRKDELEACKPRCDAGEVDAMSARLTVADVALGAGVVAGLAAAYVFFTRPAVPSSSTVIGRRVVVPYGAPTPGGGGVGGVALTF